MTMLRARRVKSPGRAEMKSDVGVVFNLPIQVQIANDDSFTILTNVWVSWTPPGGILNSRRAGKDEVWVQLQGRGTFGTTNLITQQVKTDEFGSANLVGTGLGPGTFTVVAHHIASGAEAKIDISRADDTSRTWGTPGVQYISKAGDPQANFQQDSVF